MPKDKTYVEMDVVTLLVSKLYKEDEVLILLNKVMNLGMTTRQQQLNGHGGDRSGNDILSEWWEQNKKQ